MQCKDQPSLAAVCRVRLIESLCWMIDQPSRTPLSGVALQASNHYRPRILTAELV